jgi:copper chaperone
VSRTTFNIDGMTCGHCVMTVKKALEGIDGVAVESVELGKATVSYNPAFTSPAGIANTVSKTGYTTTTAA